MTSSSRAARESHAAGAIGKAAARAVLIGDRALEESMAFDPLADDKPRPKPTHDLGQDLSTLSVHELDERIELLKSEIARLTEARGRKEASKNAASAFFKA
jgi:uncharacterized small protein (DUF1192 family)